MAYASGVFYLMKSTGQEEPLCMGPLQLNIKCAHYNYCTLLVKSSYKILEDSSTRQPIYLRVIKT